MCYQEEGRSRSRRPLRDLDMLDARLLFGPAEVADRFLLSMSYMFFPRDSFCWRKTIVTLHDITKWHDIASNVQVYTLFTVYRFGQNVSRPRTQKTIFISGRWTVWVYHSLPVVERWTTRQNWIELVPATQIVLALVLQQQGTEPFGYIVTVHVYRKYKLDVVQQFGYCCDLSENYLLAILLHFGDPGYVGVDLVSTLPIKVVKFDPRTSRAKVERAMNPCHEESLDVF